MEKCKYCQKEFKCVKNHEKHCKLNPDYDKIDHSYLHNNAIKTILLLQKKVKIKNIKHTYNFYCQKCGKEYQLELTETQYNSGKFRKTCSSSCANGHKITQETKNKISLSLKNQKEPKICNCAYCGKSYRPLTASKFCSDECKNNNKLDHYKNLSSETRQKLSEAGKKSVNIQSEIRRSKNEKYFCELCEQHFKDVEHNIPIFNGWDADIIIHDIKYAILWNGKWHYDKIKKEHSVKQVQNRDKIKISEIEKFGYIPYIIKDMGKYNEIFVNQEFEKFLNFIDFKK